MIPSKEGLSRLRDIFQFRKGQPPKENKGSPLIPDFERRPLICTGELRQTVGELIGLFSDVPDIAWLGREKLHLPKYQFEVKLIADGSDRIAEYGRSGSGSHNGSWIGVNMMSYAPMPGYEGSLPTIFEIRYIPSEHSELQHLGDGLEVRFLPDQEDPVIMFASGGEDIIQPWHNDLLYPHGHALGVVKKIIEIVNQKKENPGTPDRV